MLGDVWYKEASCLHGVVAYGIGLSIGYIHMSMPKKIHSLLMCGRVKYERLSHTIQ